MEHFTSLPLLFLDMELIDSITELFEIKRNRSVAAVCAIYPDAQTVETHLYLKLTSFCVNILIIVLFRVLILVLILVKKHFGLHFRSSSYNLNKCLVRKIYNALAENTRNQPASNLVRLSARR